MVLDVKVILIICLVVIKLSLFPLELFNQFEPFLLGQVLNAAIKAIGCGFWVHDAEFGRVSAYIITFHEKIDDLHTLISRNVSTFDGLEVFLAELQQVLLYVIKGIAALGFQSPLKLHITLFHRFLFQEIDKVEIQIGQIVALHIEWLRLLPSIFIHSSCSRRCLFHRNGFLDI